MKRGFTLIELLAVIVILAIISLIAIPIVLNIINDSKIESEKQSIKLYLRTVQTAIANQNIMKDYDPDTCNIQESGDLVCSKNNTELYINDTSKLLNVEMNGKTPVSGILHIEKGLVKTFNNLKFNSNYYVMNLDGDISIKKMDDLINFTIDDTNYSAEKNMTWEQWVLSKYNTNNFLAYDGIYVHDNNGNIKQVNNVKSNDSIKENSYITHLCYTGRFDNYGYDYNYVLKLTDYIINRPNVLDEIYNEYGYEPKLELENIVDTKDIIISEVISNVNDENIITTLSETIQILSEYCSEYCSEDYEGVDLEFLNVYATNEKYSLTDFDFISNFYNIYIDSYEEVIYDYGNSDIPVSLTIQTDGLKEKKLPYCLVMLINPQTLETVFLPIKSFDWTTGNIEIELPYLGYFAFIGIQ